MKNYIKPFLEEMDVFPIDVIMVSLSEETLDFNKGVNEEWD